MAKNLNYTNLINHTLLSPVTKEKEIIQLCEEAKKYGFASVCVNPTWVSLSAKVLRDTDVKVCTVKGFPLGASTPEMKGFETLKVIIEACLLTTKEKVRAYDINVKAGADYVKTSTEFSLHGTTTEDVAIMRKAVGPNIGVKASGGLSNTDDISAMVDAGVSRIGTSSAVKIFEL